MSRVSPPVRAVFFDAVGTLLFPEPSAPVIYAETARRHGLALTPAEVRERFIEAYRVEEQADIAINWVTSEARERERWRQIVFHTLAGVSDPESCYHFLFDHFAQPSAWRVAPDAAETLTALDRRGVLLGLGSNYDSRLWSVLAGFPELAFPRECVLISAGVGVRKPGVGFFQHAANVVGCAVEEVLFVGDDIDNDYEGATAAGMAARLLDPQGRYANVPHRITRLAELVQNV
jgi:putative hydrolase of the HAD superfamily